MRWSFDRMRAFTIAVVILCFQMVSITTTNVTEEEDAQELSYDDTDMSVEEKMRELRIKVVKFQILSKLNLKEAPPSAEPPSETSKEVIRLLMKEDEERKIKQQRQIFDGGEQLVIHAKGNGMPCLLSNESFCKMFQYELNTSLNTSSMDIWIYKLTEVPKWISISLSFSNSYEEKYYDVLYYEVNQIGWNKLQLPRILLPSSWNDSIFYSAEVTGQNIEDRGDHRPFLMVSKLYYMATRQRRDITCDTNQSCCWKPLRVSFAEIGFNWVVYPAELQVNMCAGKCTMDHSSLKTHYERAMTKVLESDTALHSTLGECWTLCCKPKILEPVRVIYKDTDDIIHVQYIPELSVKSCGCS